MISDKFTMQFYQFTKQNIAGIAAQDCDRLDTSQSKQPLRSISVVLILAMAAGIVCFFSGFVDNGLTLASVRKHLGHHLEHGENVAFVLNTTLPKQTNTPSELRRVSLIPMFRVSAMRQIVQAVPLRKADQIAINHDDFSRESWVVMDKVIVIPKVIG